MTLVNIRKKTLIFLFSFLPVGIPMFVHFHDDWAKAEPIFCCDVSEFFSCLQYFGVIRCDPWRFFDIPIIFCQKLHFNKVFWVLYKKFSMAWLSIQGNNCIACWAYAEMTSLNTESMPNKFLCMLSQCSNFDSFYMDIQTHTELTGKQCRHLLRIRGYNFITCWAHTETISLLAEHMRNWFHSLRSQPRNLLQTNFAGPAESPYCIQPANLRSELCIYELFTASNHSYLTCSHYTWAILYV
jgi:hypothetical protein